MRNLAVIALFVAQIPLSVAQAGVEGAYGTHLYFNEKEFVDVLTVERAQDGQLTGLMHVPDDFDAAISAARLEERRFSFDLLVPNNAARPQDLLFQYKAEFFDSNYQQMIGFVTLRGESEFIASFVGFKRNPTPSVPKIESEK